MRPTQPEHKCSAEGQAGAVEYGPPEGGPRLPSALAVVPESRPLRRLPEVSRLPAPAAHRSRGEDPPPHQPLDGCELVIQIRLPKEANWPLWEGTSSHQWLMMGPIDPGAGASAAVVVAVVVVVVVSVHFGREGG